MMTGGSPIEIGNLHEEQCGDTRKQSQYIVESQRSPNETMVDVGDRNTYLGSHLDHLGGA